MPNTPDFFESVNVGEGRQVDGRIAWGWKCPQMGCVSETHYVITLHMPQLELRCVSCETVHAVEL